MMIGLWEVIHFQVIPDHWIPREAGHRLAVIYSNIAVLNTKMFTKYLMTLANKQIDTKKPPENLKSFAEC